MRLIIDKIKISIRNKKVKFSSHAREEMEYEEFGKITKDEVYDSILNGYVIEDYPNDKPYPCCLIYGKTSKGGHIHSVCAYITEEDTTIIITVYEPNPIRWINYEKRK